MRSEYYQKLSCYEYLSNIRQMIQRNKADEVMLQSVKDGLERKLFKANDYIQHPFIKQDCWVPLIYAFCLFEHYQGTVKMLLTRGANPLLEPDVDIENLEPIIFACHSRYLDHLIKMGCRAKYTKHVLEHNILSQLSRAKWRRIFILELNGYIDRSQITQSYDGDLVMYCIKCMKEYLMYCYNIRQDPIDKTEETNSIILQFVETIQYIFRCGYELSLEVIDFCIKFYMYEFLLLEKFRAIIQGEQFHVIFHEDMDPVVVATYRPLLNDGRYTMTCKALGLQPDPRIKTK